MSNQSGDSGLGHFTGLIPGFLDSIQTCCMFLLWFYLHGIKPGVFPSIAKVLDTMEPFDLEKEMKEAMLKLQARFLADSSCDCFGFSFEDLTELTFEHVLINCCLLEI